MYFYYFFGRPQHYFDILIFYINQLFLLSLRVVKRRQNSAGRYAPGYRYPTSWALARTLATLRITDATVDLLSRLE
jgi:hypothetical protein